MEIEKDEILERIGILFYKYGIKSISMDDIAKELGISKKTLYQRFENKRELVERVIQYHNDLLICDLDNIERNAEDAIEVHMQLILISKKWIEGINPSFEYDLEKYYGDVCRKNQEEQMIIMKQFHKRNLKRGIEEGVYREDINIDIITNIHITTVINLHTTGLFSKEDLMSFELYWQYFLLIMRGIASLKGLDRLAVEIEEYGLNKIKGNKNL